MKAKGFPFLESPACARVLKAMSDPTRLRLLRRLVSGERSVSELAEDLSLPQPTVSHHLAILRSAGLVLEERAGRRVLNRLHPSAARSLAAGEETIELGCCAVSLRRD